jgi:hypothetical protein
MRLRTWTSAPLPSTPQPLEVIRETIAVAAPSTPVTARSRTLFASSHLHCQRGGPERSGEECLACARIVSIRPSDGRRTITIRCLWTEADPVTDVMTLAERAVCVAPETPIADADALAAREEVHHLLVVEDREVVGVTCRCALVGPAGLVGARMIPHVWTVPATTTLGQAAQAIRDLEVGLLVVADQGELLGVVTAAEIGLDPAPHVH